MLDVGEIGIFELNGDAYVKKLGHGEFISLNPKYKPISIHEFDSIHVFGKVIC
jgi:phage repressor protein C with HTH and peptisase S24 domain